ncbi:ribonuclease H-like domain-containing protein [Natronococcus roseus]|uniref:ribonuclease H-like domain-containing protein n=1 Tax=Natronococcus roseus TaxID=1052014 RepID=UPI00374D6B06
MTSHAGARLLALPPSAVLGRPAEILADVDATLEPDAIWLLGPEREARAFAQTRQAFDAPAFHPPLETNGEVVSRQPIGTELEVAVVRSLRALRASPADVSSVLSDPRSRSSPIAVVCDDVTTTTRPTALETALEGAAELAAALPTGRVTTVLSGSIPAGYDELWHLEAETGTVRAVEHEPQLECEPAGDDCVSVRVRGIGPVEGYGGSASLAVLEVDETGVAAVDTSETSNFGLEAVSGIGPKTAERLANDEVTTRAELLETPIDELADYPGVGRDGARRMHRHATVLETGEPRRLTDESLPAEGGRPPLCLDIETDGLSPTILWQIGVYDPADDSYRAFVECDEPDDPAPVLEALCDWLFASHSDRALLTWNGWRFDYRHLGAFVARHVPYYVEEWESVPKFDLYDWAVREGHALLPGRTNKLEDVAGALGYEGTGTGLDGARTAAAYQRFLRTGEELDWGRHEAYCEDDCRALWHVYERLRDAPRAADPSDASPAEAEGATPAGTTGGEQTGLGDF